ncbi:RNA-binding motif protein, X-linked-like-3 isoform X2 [Corticium candelabrum]|uniref:RNA-binding motif protein, X-linked-like-3 isoform X2 n=1 Tax=Corticium candelabrum TaxID=121492 RepID=UPI002E267DF9|nr:RNA-binding motif protein, X-linked-like-3 isoform X2 [Corticium candelabrum]
METAVKQPEAPQNPRKVFLGGINSDIDESVIQEAFAKFGKIAEVLIIRDKETGFTKGYGFITFETAESATKAVAEMHSQTIRGRTLTVQIARPDTGKESFQRRRQGEYRRSPPLRRMGRDQNRSRSRSRERREPRRGTWGEQNNRDAGRGRWRGRDDGDLRHQIREQERIHMQRREQESRDTWHGNDGSYGSRPRGEMAGYGRGAQTDRRFTRWDPNEDESRRSQMGGAQATSEVSGYYGEGHGYSTGYYNDRQEQERQREFRMKRDVSWGVNQEAGGRVDDQYYNTNRQQQMGDSAYRQDDRQRMRSDQVRSAYRSDNERMYAKGDDRMRIDRDRMGAGVSKERMGANEWAGQQMEGEQIGARVDRTGMSDRAAGMADRIGVGGASRMGTSDRLSVPQRLGEPGRMGGYERAGLPERSDLSERGGLLERTAISDRLGAPERAVTREQMGGAERRSGDGRIGMNHPREWTGTRSHGERMADRLENEIPRPREDLSRWRWSQEDQQGATRSDLGGRMDSQRERSYVPTQPEGQMSRGESRWEEQRPTQQPSSRYYDERQGERRMTPSDGYRDPSSHQQSVPQQSRWEPRDSARLPASQYDPYGRPTATFSDESSRFPQQSNPYSDSRAAGSAGRPHASRLAPQPYATSEEQTRNFIREYEGYSPTKPQIYEEEEYSHQPSRYSRDSQEKSYSDPSSYRASNAYSRKPDNSQTYPSSSPQSGPRRVGEELEASRRGYRSSYPSDNPHESSQNSRYSYFQSQSRADTSGYSQSSDWKDAHPMSRSEFQQSSYNEATNKHNPNLNPSHSSSSQSQHIDPSSSQPNSAATSTPALSEASNAPNPGSTAGNRVQIVNSPAVLPIRPVNTVPTVSLRAPMYGYRAPILLRPQVGMPALRGLAAQVFPFAGNRPVRPQ